MIEVKNLRQSYKFYKELSYTGETTKLELNVYLEIIYGFIKFIMRKVFEGHDVKLGPGDSLGAIGLRGKRQKFYIDKETGHVRGLAVDWKKTKDLWAESPEAKADKTLIYCTNEHTGGLRYSIVWWTKEMRLHNKIFYYLKFSRNNRRRAASHIKEGAEYPVNVERVAKKRNNRYRSTLQIIDDTI